MTRSIWIVEAAATVVYVITPESTVPVGAPAPGPSGIAIEIADPIGVRTGPIAAATA